MTGPAVVVPRKGDSVPPLERLITRDGIMAYGAATWDWHRLHYDLEFARGQGLSDVPLDGQALGAYFAATVVDWLGPRAFIRKMSFRMRGMVFAGDTIRCGGEVVSVTEKDGAAFVGVTQRLTVGARLAADAETEIRLAT